MKQWTHRICDCRAYAVVEATILFPIMIMIFFAMVLLAVYLPQRVILQEAAQSAATTIAAEISDTYVSFDDDGNYVGALNLANVYVAAIQGTFGSALNAEEKAAGIVEHYAGSGVFSVPGNIEVTYETKNYVIYQEIMVRASQRIPIPVDFSFIGFPTEIEIIQEARAVIQNGDEFVRNIDIAKDIMKWIDKKFGFSDSLRDSGAMDTISEVMQFFGFGG